MKADRLVQWRHIKSTKDVKILHFYFWCRIYKKARWFKSRCRQRFTKFIKFLLIQQFTKSPVFFLWDSAYVRAFWRAMMKSGLPPLKTSLAVAWTHSQCPVFVSSLKNVKPLSPVFITEDRTNWCNTDSHDMLKTSIRVESVFRVRVSCWISHSWGGCRRSTSCRRRGWTDIRSLLWPTRSLCIPKPASLWRETNERTGAYRSCFNLMHQHINTDLCWKL